MPVAVSIAACAVAQIVVEARRPGAAASARGSGSGGRPGGPRRRSASRSPGAPRPSGPARRTSRGLPASPSVSRMRSALPGGHQGRSGCSASNVNATAGAPHSRVVTFDGVHVRAGLAARRRSRAATRGAARARSTRPARAAGPSVRCRSAQRADAGRDGPRPRCRDRGSSPASRDVEVARLGLGGDDHRGEIGPRQLERSVAELGRLQRLDRQPDRFLQRERAHLGGRARTTSRRG